MKPSCFFFKFKVISFVFIISNSYGNIAYSETLNSGISSSPLTHVQFSYGRLGLNNNELEREFDEQYTSDWAEDVPYIGLTFQSPINNNVFSYGLEGGAMFSWQSEVLAYAVGNGAAKIRVDSNYYAFEPFIGGFVSFKPIKRLRFHASAGPLVSLAYVDAEDISPPSTQPTTSALVVLNESEYEFGYGLYAKTGVELMLGQGFWLGLVARYSQLDYEFDNTIGDLDLDGTTVSFTFGAEM